MSFFQNLATFEKLQLDIVGIVAILGEGAVERHAQALSLSWHHALPRLLPAPQAFLVRQEESHLPATPGTVVGVFSGNVKKELNFFTNLLHRDDLQKYEVQLVVVKEKCHDRNKEEPIFTLKQNAHLTALSVFSTCLSGIILGLSIWQKDGPALLAVVLLSLTSGLVGTASLCRVNNMPINMSRRAEHIPPGDLVIYYPKKAAFRVVRCDEAVARNYFRTEELNPRVSSHIWRTIMLVATILLVGGLIMLGNSSSQMQAAFAAAYVLLNTLYWLSSTVDFTAALWSHDFDIDSIKVLPSAPGSVDIRPKSAEHSENEDDGDKKPLRSRTIDIIGQPRRPTTLSRFLATLSDPKPQQSPVQEARARQDLMHRATFTTALWTAIAVSGSARWVRNAQLAPTTLAWDKWLEEAERRSRPAWSPTKMKFISACTEIPAGIRLPAWDYKSRLEDLFKEEERRNEATLDEPTTRAEGGLGLSIFAIVMLKRWGRKARRSRHQWKTS